MWACIDVCILYVSISKRMSWQTHQHTRNHNHTHARTYARTHARTHTHTHTNAHTHTFVEPYTHTHTALKLHLFVVKMPFPDGALGRRPPVHPTFYHREFVYIHTHTHTHTRTHIHTHTVGVGVRQRGSTLDQRHCHREPQRAERTESRKAALDALPLSLSLTDRT